uniref:Putative secreted protein n=1 Tax=Ixodes ricinus TaxID=34613 RepID=A0A147BGI2_IXORI
MLRVASAGSSFICLVLFLQSSPSSSERAGPSSPSHGHLLADTEYFIIVRIFRDVSLFFFVCYRTLCFLKKYGTSFRLSSELLPSFESLGSLDAARCDVETKEGWHATVRFMSGSFG